MLYPWLKPQWNAFGNVIMNSFSWCTVVKTGIPFAMRCVGEISDILWRRNWSHSLFSAGNSAFASISILSA